ncbi:AAA family ATPase [Empedobacter falsenii]|uniref:LuxR family transcriptional regulator n=2 Tax=Empedobacter falsenii TaxID=343874 RepID=A0A3R8SR79_9FLAO|nr:AAA family ATPase [Empedobacter falsenii]RRT90083.1 LuxR family transcriptional regulator [Empedobacter falsenii]RRT90140.1 LuxR family transcriptional regulator [Empedobacter falsenii]
MSKSNFGDSKSESRGKTYFKTKPLNKWLEEAKSQKKRKPILGNIIQSGELVVFFADTGVGKTTFAYCVLYTITSNKMFLNLETTFFKSLYFDFELSSYSVYERFSNHTNGSIHQFNENFIRAEINLDSVDLTDPLSGNFIIENIKNEILTNDIQVVCIDNISFIATDNEKSRFATQLMKGLLQLTRKLGITIIVLAHEPKEDKFNSKITLNRLAGSKALSNYADVVFALGKSTTWGIVYLKELKNRNREILYHENNVMVLERIKKDNFLTFDFVRFDSENNLIDFNPSEERNMKILKMSNDGISNVKIGEEFNLSEGAIRKILKKIQE